MRSSPRTRAGGSRHGDRRCVRTAAPQGRDLAVRRHALEAGHDGDLAGVDGGGDGVRLRGAVADDPTRQQTQLTEVTLDGAEVPAVVVGSQIEEIDAQRDQWSYVVFFAALLHDTVEDTDYSLEDLEEEFGAEVAKLVDGVTKLDKVALGTAAEGETIRKMIIAMARDPRVLVIKVADRLHNMRTLHHIKNEEKRRRIARETLDIYAPLAERIGMYEFMREMQLLAFKELEPDAYASITGQLEYYGGCNAGRTGLGIEADGTIKGCPSLPTADYAGGNVRDKVLLNAPDAQHGFFAVPKVIE